MPARASVPRTRADVVEDSRDIGMQLAAPVVAADRAVEAVEQWSAEVRFEHADAMGDGGRGDAELPRGADEALVPRGSIEEAEAIEWRQCWHGFGSRQMVTR